MSSDLYDASTPEITGKTIKEITQYDAEHIGGGVVRFSNVAQIPEVIFPWIQAASQAAQTGDQALMAQTAEQYNVASINSIIAGSSSAAIYTLFWGVFGIAGYIFYVSLISTRALILRSGNYYLSNLMNQITGYGFGIAGIVFLILNIIWKVNTEWGFRIFAISQIVWVILVIILAINFIRSDKK